LEYAGHVATLDQPRSDKVLVSRRLVSICGVSDSQNCIASRFAGS